MAQATEYRQASAHQWCRLDKVQAIWKVCHVSSTGEHELLIAAVLCDAGKLHLRAKKLVIVQALLAAAAG